MKKRYAFIAAVFAAALFTSMTPSVAYADPTSEEIQEDIDKKSSDLEKVIEKYNGAKEDLEDTKDRIKEIEKTLPDLEKAAEKSREIVSNIAVNEYTRGGKVSAASTIMSGSPDAALQRMTLLGAINASQAADVDSYGSSADDLEDEKAELEDLKADQKKTKSDLQEKKDKIEGEVADLEEQQRALDAQNGGGTGGSRDGNLPGAPSGNAGAAVEFAYAQIGEPYVYGAAGPDSWDCSGLTMGAWNAAGFGLSHQTNAQWNETARVSRGELAAGDLVFYNDLNHVGLYVGDGTIVHAPQSGQNVQTAGIDDMPIVGYGRVG